MISGFTFIHNANEGGYPLREAIAAVRPFVDEMLVVDMASTDGTREWLLSQIREDRNFRMIEGKWVPGGGSHECLNLAHYMHRACRGHTILHFEADEVFDPLCVMEIVQRIKGGRRWQSVYRLQVEQNFQRVRWYPELVHRVFPNNAGVHKVGHTTNKHNMAASLPQRFGYLWDVTNCFRDNMLGRERLHAELWKPERVRAVPLHFTQSIYPQETESLDVFLSHPHWTWKRSPLNLPNSLASLVGVTKYHLDPKKMVRVE